jgi:phytoene synthase
MSAYLLVPEGERQRLDHRFWAGALAVEMVHEASLLHDDILDEAPQRRGRPTMAAAVGVGPALVLGDHLLTSAYRAAADTGSNDFLKVFIRAVERTVAGEIAQERSQGRILAETEYLRNITWKSGELFGSAFTLAPTLLGIGSAEAAAELGARFGRLYQMVDDFLDYCPAADRGKVPLQDYRQKKWTWPLGLIGVRDFEISDREVLARLFTPTAASERSPMEEGAGRMEREFQLLLQDLAGEGFETEELADLLHGWQHLLHGVAEREKEARRASSRPMGAEEAVATSTVSAAKNPRPSTGSALHWDLKAAAAPLETTEGRLAYFGHHAKSFRFASRLFPQDELERVAGVYAFCRFTDDLVDEVAHEDADLAAARLTTWLELAGRAYRKEATGIVLLDEVMGEMRKARVPFHYAEELVEGMRMDLEITSYPTLEDLRVYSYRVASVVGGWLTELFGVHDPWVLERAYALGHAMQLTNILRDVGEDLSRGRVYLPQDLMEKHGVDVGLLESGARRNGSLGIPGYRDLLETLIAEAEADYTKAFEAIPSLPSFFQGPVAVAASVYRGIHREIRKNGYDNLNLRASTSLFRKVNLGAAGFLALRRASSRSAPTSPESTPPLRNFGDEEGREAVS